MPDPALPPRPASYDKTIGLVLQGGGALGSYQAGVFAALADSDYVPDWVAGISIGAINAAIIAGNAPSDRVGKLREFWEGITALPAFVPQAVAGLVNAVAGEHQALGAASALLFGQPGFFAPVDPLAWWRGLILGTQPVSFYDTSALKGTLERLVDFDRINAREVRFSVGAVNVRTGNFAYFDNHHIVIRPEHVMASGALPPGFAAVEIDGEEYWDGGLVSNTPLQYILDHVPRRSRLTFQVDVFSARGKLPRSLSEVQEREKDIRYSSRTRAATNTMRLMQDLRHNINALLKQLPPELRATEEARYLYEFGCVTTMDIAQVIYRPEEAQGLAKDYEFSRATMETRWQQGLADARETLRASPWLAPAPHALGARTFDVVGDRQGLGKGPISSQVPARTLT